MKRKWMFVLFAVMLGACGVQADKLGVGAECTKNEDCNQDNKQSCLTNFKGGYYGSADCTGDADCPTGSTCVTHTDSKNYCFRTCNDKTECNANRTAANESNCSANITLVDGTKGTKACVPPAGA